MTERAISIVLLIATIYGGCWAALCEPELFPVFGFLIAVGIWSVLVIWDAPQFDE